jgi:hypothetical protein
VKPAEVRFSVDADILGLGKLLGGLRPDITYPGDPGTTLHKRVRPPCASATPRTKDPNWIPLVTQQGLLILTRDANIQQHHAELDAVRANQARTVALSSRDATATWSQLEVVMCQWREIEKLSEPRGPFIDTATRTTLAKVP